MFEQGHTHHELNWGAESRWWLHHRSISFLEMSFLKKFIYLFLTALGLHCCVWAFSSCGEQGPLSRCGVRASYCGGFSGGGAWTQGCTGPVVVTQGLSCSKAWGILPDRGSNPRSSRLAGGLPPTAAPGCPRLHRAASDATVSQLLAKTPAKSLKGVTLKWKQWSKLSGIKADASCWRKMWNKAFFFFWYCYYGDDGGFPTQSFFYSPIHCL